MFAGGYPAIPADKVQVIGTMHHQLGKQCIVVIVFRQVAVRAHFGLADHLCMHIGVAKRWIAGRTAADGVRNVGAKGNSAQPLSRNRLLLHVNRLTVDIVGTHVNGA